MIYSTDGIAWLPSSNGNIDFSGGTCNAIAWNGYTWVAGGSATAASKLVYSSNGIFWNPSSSGTSLLTQGCSAIVTSGSLWVAGGAGTNRVIYGYDGIHWYPSNTANNLLTESCLAAAWNGAVWILGGSGEHSLIYSNDGISWLESNNGNTLFRTCKALAWNGSLWIAGGIPAIGRTNTLAYSYDGVDWKTVSTPLSLRTSCNAVAWSGAQWVAGGTDPSNTLIYSADGFTWTPAQDVSGLFTSCNSVTWTGTLWIAGGTGSNSFLNSYDGIRWNPIPTANALQTTCNAIAVNKILPNAPIVEHINTVIPTTPLMLLGGAAVGGIGSILSSSADGITWSPNPSANAIFVGSTCRALGWDGDQWIAGFSDGAAYLGNSYDGITWNANASASTLLTRGCYSLAANGSLWLAGGAGLHRMISSSNGLNWRSVAQADAVFVDASCLSIAYNGSLWVAGSNSSNNRLATSVDGSGTWTASASANSIFTSFCSSITWNGFLWVAVGATNSEGRIAYSSDGTTWTRAATFPTATYWSSVAWNGLVWVIGGSGANPLAYSYDGNVWLASPNAATIFTTDCTSVTWSGNLFLWVAAGNGTNTAAYSFNGITWIHSYNSTSIMQQSNCVAINRLLVNAGITYPPPVLNPSPATAGRAVYSTGFNNLNVSSTLTISDLSGSLGVNRGPGTYVDQTGRTVSPTVDVSGQGFWAATDAPNTFPGLYLTNTNTAGAPNGYAGRILMQNTTSNWGWSIDSLWGLNSGITIDKSLQIVQWIDNQSNIVMDFNEEGYVGVNCIPNSPRGDITFIMDISGSTRVRDNFFVTNHTNLIDLSATIIDTGSLFVRNYTRVVDLSATIIGTGSLFVRNNTRVVDLSASIIAATGPIASSLTLSNRGIIDASVNLIEGTNTLSNWTAIYPISGTVQNYSTFLVTVNAVFDASNVSPLMTSTLDISVNGVTKYFLAGTDAPDTHKLYPINFTFIVNPIANAITVSGFASSGVFVNTNGTNYLTTVDILGLT
jgi:hypothetical protein